MGYVPQESYAQASEFLANYHHARQILEGFIQGPDEEVRGAVSLVFRLFRETGSGFAVMQRFAAGALRFPKRAYGGASDGKLIWGRLTHGRVLGLLKNPSYAERYVFGRYRNRREISPEGKVHPQKHGVAQGLLLCGHCGRRLTVRYTGNGGIYPRYPCNWLRRENLGTSKECLNLRCDLLDAAVAEEVLKALQAAELELALAALAELESRDQALGRQGQMRVERAEYEATLAERRYLEVDPSQRLVASTLELIIILDISGGLRRPPLNSYVSHKRSSCSQCLSAHNGKPGNAFSDDRIHSRGRQRTPPIPTDQRTRQASVALRGQVPNYRFRTEQFSEFGHLFHLRVDAV
jgi:hypothetical protein